MSSAETLCRAGPTLSRRRLVGAISSLTALVLAACSASPGTGASDTAGQPKPLKTGARLTWMFGTAASNPGVREALEEVARDFERKHAGLTVEPLLVSDAYLDKLQNLLVAGTPPEVFWLDVRSFPA